MNTGLGGVGGAGGRNRTVLFATATTLGVGLAGVGLGGMLGGITVYYFIIRRRLASIFAFQRSIRVEIEGLKAEIRQLKSDRNSDPNQGKISTSHQEGVGNLLKSSLKEKRNVKFVGGYDTADDEEYITASSPEISSNSENDENEDLSGLARRVKGSENTPPMRDVRERKIKKPDNLTAHEKLFLKVDELFEGDSGDQDKAFDNLKHYENQLSHSSEFWWRLAKATHLKATTAGSIGDRELMKDYSFDAFSYADKALELNSECANVHKWYAITLGSKGKFVSRNEKIRNGYKFKEHIDKAISLSPADSTLHYLIGRFCYEVSQLSWIERQIASALFSTPPSSSLEEALQHFQSAEEIGKPFKDNRLFMAKCYIGLSDWDNAGRYLNLASILPVRTPTDKEAEEEINSLLQNCRRYIN